MSSCARVRKTPLLHRLHTKCSILPRQARDKHRENSKKRVAAFFAGRRVLVRGGALVSLSHMDRAGFFTPRCDTKHNRTHPGRLSVLFPYET
jgi:hypothetical protein